MPSPASMPIGIVHRPSGTARALLTLIRDRPCTRAELMERTGRGRTALGRDLSALARTGLIRTGEHLASRNGRPAELLSFNPRAGVVAACLIGAGRAQVAVADFGGTVLASCTETFDCEREPEDTVQRLAACWQALLDEVGREPPSISAIAIGVPWFVDRAGTRIVGAPGARRWEGFDLAGAVAAGQRVPVVVERDANVTVVGERLLRCPDEHDLIFVKLDASIGAGMLVGGRIARGASGSAGDIAHVPVPGDDRPCTCGERGCLEAVASGDALARRLREAGVRLDDDDLAAHLASPSPEAARLVRDAGRAVGGVLSTVVSTANPSSVVLGGSVAAAGPPLLAAVRVEIYRQSRVAATQDLRVDASADWQQAAIAGAGRLAVDALLAHDPRETALELTGSAA